MKILFVYLVPYEPTYQEGIASISALLKKESHETDLLILNSFEEKKIKSKISKSNPDIVLLSFQTNQFNLSKKVIDYIYGKYDLPILVGGVHATFAPYETISIEGVFSLCRGEGEFPSLELVNNLEKGKEYRNIENLWFKEDGKIIKNPLRPPIEDLSQLPMPDRSIFEKNYSLRNMDFVFSRGCIYDCSYCCCSGFNKTYNGDFFRLKKADRVIKEIKEYLKYSTRVRFLVFNDSIFPVDFDWLKKFCESYSNEISLPFMCPGHVNNVNREILDLLKNAGCIRMPLGLESGNDYIRNKVLKKNISRNRIIKSFDLVKDYGIETMSWNILGSPYETKESIKDTIKLNKKIEPKYLFTSIFRPFPGTELYDLCKSKGWISNREVKSINDPVCILDQPTISHKKVEYYYKEFFNGGFIDINDFLIKTRDI